MRTFVPHNRGPAAYVNQQLPQAFNRAVEHTRLVAGELLWLDTAFARGEKDIPMTQTRPRG